MDPMDPMDRGRKDLDHGSSGADAAGSGYAARPHAATGYGFGGDALLAETDPSDTGSSAPGGNDPGAPRPARTVQLIAGDLLVTVNPVDGSEIEPCPPGHRPAAPARYSAEERAERARAARPPLPQGPALHRPLLAERQEDRARLVRLLSRGRSVRLTGPHGSGRSTFLDAAAEDCAHLAPDGVIRLSGHRRTVRDVLYDLFAAVYEKGAYRPDDALLRELVGEIGAVVVLDDVEFGGTALDELLEATPECAFVLVTTADTPGPSADSHLEEMFLRGVGRDGGMALLRSTAGRDLTEEEADWARDLWFASEGLPVRFVQAGALLHHRDRMSAAADPLTDGAASGLPLPSLAEGAAPVALLASLLSASAQATLRFAVALGGEVPHRAQLPALLADPHADAVLAELLTAGLITAVGARYRLAAGVQAQLEAVGFAADAAERAHTAGEHYAWWAGHRSVAPERVLAESDAVLATLAALVLHTTAPPVGPAAAGDDARSLAVQLARTAAPVLAAGLDWGVWERSLRSGQEAARRAGEVAQEAYFHHELGVLALCTGRLDRARAELEASIGLRGALADKRGSVAGRRALALVTDRSTLAERPAAVDASGGSATLGGQALGRPSAGAGQPRPVPRSPEPGAPGAGPYGTQTSFGAGVPFVAPDAADDPATTELRLVTDEPDRPGAGAGPAGGAAGGAALSGAPEEFGPTASDGPATLISRAPGRVDGPSKPAGARPERHRAAARNTRRNLAAAAGGALLAAVLGTVVTLGTTSDHKQSGTVQPDPPASQDDNDGITADEPAQHPTDQASASASDTAGSPSASISDSPTVSASGSTPQDGGGSSGRPTSSSKPTSGSTSRPPTHRPPTSKPPTSKPPTSKPPTSSSPSAPPSGSPSPAPADPVASDSQSGSTLPPGASRRRGAGAPGRRGAGGGESDRAPAGTPCSASTPVRVPPLRAGRGAPCPRVRGTGTRRSRTALRLLYPTGRAPEDRGIGRPQRLAAAGR